MQTSIVIYTNNNEDTVFKVVAACCKYNPESEVIVIDDGSYDKTESLLKTLSIHFSFLYIKLKRYYGIGSAIMEGVECASGDIILLLDAGWKNLRKENFENAFVPMYNMNCDMVVTFPTNIFINYNRNPFISCLTMRTMLKTDLLLLKADLQEMKYNLSMFIDLYFLLKGKIVKFISYNQEEQNRSSPRLINPVKVEKEENCSLLFPMLYLSDIELVIKRLKNLISKNENYTWFTISSVQSELNRRIEELK